MHRGMLSEFFSHTEICPTDHSRILPTENVSYVRGKSFARSQSICTRIEIHLFFLGGNDVALWWLRWSWWHLWTLPLSCPSSLPHEVPWTSGCWEGKSGGQKWTSSVWSVDTVPSSIIQGCCQTNQCVCFVVVFVAEQPLCFHLACIHRTGLSSSCAESPNPWVGNRVVLGVKKESQSLNN